MDAFENDVQTYIDEQIKSQKVFTGEITERKLAVQQHNSWQFNGRREVMILSKDLQGRVLAPGLIILQDFIMHPFQALVFTVTYRVQFKMTDGALLDRDFVLAQGSFLPKVSDTPDIVTVEMQSGPGVAIGGEIMWDATKVGKAGMQVTVSMTENISGQLIE